MNRNNYRSLGEYCDNNALCGGYDYGNIQSYEFAKCNTVKENYEENYDNKKYKVITNPFMEKYDQKYKTITNPFFRNVAANSDFREQYKKGIL